MAPPGRLALVTGGAGFIGARLSQALVESGWGVRVLDDESTGRAERLHAVADRVEWLRADLCDERALDRAAAGAQCVFHLAAIASVPRSVAEPLETQRVNLQGSLRVLEAARRHGARRVVFASSSAVYGEGSGRPSREEDAPEPLSPYALQKLSAEHYLRLYDRLHGIETVSLRLFNVYGPGQDPRSGYAAVIPSFLDAGLRGRPLRVHGRGEQTRDFVYVGDVVQALQIAADAPGISGRCFNVASGRATRVIDLLPLLEDLLGRPLEVVHEAARSGDLRRSEADPRAAREKLGFAAGTDLEAGLRLILQALARDGATREVSK